MLTKQPNFSKEDLFVISKSIDSTRFFVVNIFQQSDFPTILSLSSFITCDL